MTRLWSRSVFLFNGTVGGIAQAVLVLSVRSRKVHLKRGSSWLMGPGTTSPSTGQSCRSGGQPEPVHHGIITRSYAVYHYNSPFHQPRNKLLGECRAESAQRPAWIMYSARGWVFRSSPSCFHHAVQWDNQGLKKKKPKMVVLLKLNSRGTV